MLTAGLGLLIHCFFGSFLANEWTYWVMALLVRYSELYKVGEQASVAAEPLRPRSRVAHRPPTASPQSQRSRNCAVASR